jgi:hypothetical protein
LDQINREAQQRLSIKRGGPDEKRFDFFVGLLFLAAYFQLFRVYYEIMRKKY